MMFNTGALAGQFFPITSQTNAAFTLDIPTSSAARLASGDIAVIGNPAFANTIVGNYVDTTPTNTGVAIMLYGLCYGNTITGNSIRGNGTSGVGNITIDSLNNLAVPTPSRTGHQPMAPCESNIVSGNILNQTNVVLTYQDFGGTTASFLNHNNIVDNLNVFLGGAVAKTNQAANGNGTGPIIFKTADETRTSTTTLADDTELKTVLLASRYYLVEAFLLVDAANATMDFKFGWHNSAGTGSLRWGVLNDGTVTPSWGSVASGTTGVLSGSASTSVAVGTVTASTTAMLVSAAAWVTTVGASGPATVSLQWAQNTSDGGNLTVKTGSFLRVTQLA